jgi:hypothetical protein
MTQNSISYGGITIPGPQAQPPAGHPDIAFRPACGQVGAVLQANGLVAHTIPLPDGGIRILREMPPMDGGKVVRELDTAGLCKVGGIDVPIIFADQLPQQSIGQVAGSVGDAPPVATVATDGAGFPWLITFGAFFIVGFGVTSLVLLMAKRRRHSPGDTVRVEPIITPPPADKPTEAPTEGTSTAASADLVDQLWG